MNRAAGYFGLAFFLLLGLGSLVLPKTIQVIALKTCVRFYGFENPLVGWMKTEQYVWTLRALGVLFVVGVIFVGIVSLAQK
jgi:hypothetical protein